MMRNYEDVMLKMKYNRVDALMLFVRKDFPAKSEVTIPYMSCARMVSMVKIHGCNNQFEEISYPSWHKASLIAKPEVIPHMHGLHKDEFNGEDSWWQQSV